MIIPLEYKMSDYCPSSNDTDEKCLSKIHLWNLTIRVIF